MNVHQIFAKNDERAAFNLIRKIASNFGWAIAVVTPRDVIDTVLEHVDSDADQEHSDAQWNANETALLAWLRANNWKTWIEDSMWAAAQDVMLEGIGMEPWALTNEEN